MAAQHGNFMFTISCPRVVFGPDSINSLPEELRRLGVKRPVIVCSPTRVSLAYRIGNILQQHAASVTLAGVVDRAVVHVPVDVTETSCSYVRSHGADSVISTGGGSAIGLAKAICFRTGLPHICLPTTYSGSEMTSILGELVDGKKVAINNPKLLPSTVLYDVNLTMHLPKHVTAASGLNALAHSIEALYAEGANPVASLLALESISLLARSLPRVIADLSSVKERSSVLYGASLAGMAVESTGIAFHHKLAHTVAGCCNLPHADTHAILLPHTVAYNLCGLDQDVIERLGVALLDQKAASSSDIISALGTLLRTLEVRYALKDIGMGEDEIDRTADAAMEKQYWNPRSLERDKVREIIRRAWAGEVARADL